MYVFNACVRIGIAIVVFNMHSDYFHFLAQIIRENIFFYVEVTVS